MAIRTLTPRQEALDEELLQALKAEMEQPEGAESSPGAPVIYLEESDLPDRFTHWYVVWQRFAEVDDEERSRLIIRAVRETRGVEEALRVTVAMGVTPDEAKTMGLPQA